MSKQVLLSEGSLVDEAGTRVSITVDDVTLGDDVTIAGDAAVTGTLTVTGGTSQNGHLTFGDAKNVVLDTTTGTKIGTATNQKLGFFNTAPVVQPSAYTQTFSTADKTHASRTTAAMTDNSTGAVGVTFAAGVGVYELSIPIALAGVTAADVLTTLTLGHKFKILAVAFAVTTVASTADKLATLNLEIGTTNVTGGEVALTTANCTPLGAVVAGAAVTAANTGSAADTISIEASSVTAFAEGAGVLVIRVQNMDTADAIASLSDQLTKAVADLADTAQFANATVDSLQALGLVA